MQLIITLVIGFSVYFSGGESLASEGKTEKKNNTVETSEKTLGTSVETTDTPVDTALYDSEKYPRIERAISLLTANPTRKQTFLVIVDHRNRDSFTEEPFHNLYGFDGGGLKIGLGLRYGVLDFLDVGIFRVNGTVEVFDTYDFDLRYQFFNQQDHSVDVAIRPGFSWFSEKDDDDGAGGFCQLLVSRTFKEKFILGTGILYHSDSSNETKSNKDVEHSIAIQALFEARLLHWLSWDVEMAANVGGYGSAHPQFRSGFKIITPRHTFALTVSNTQYMSASGVVSNTDRDFDDMVLGFSISREIKW